MAGRPRKEPGTRVHDTRDRHFLQVERNPEFDAAVEAARIKIAAARSLVQHRDVSPNEVSMAHAVRAALNWFVEHYHVGE